MKIQKNTTLPLIALMVMSMLCACEEKEDYSHIVFKNYLTYEINRATNFLHSTLEGTAEGEYNPGSKQTYQGRQRPTLRGEVLAPRREPLLDCC